MHTGPDRRKTSLSEEDIENIAKRAKEMALQDIYTAVGKSVITKIMWVLGAAAAAFTAWHQGLFKVGN